MRSPILIAGENRYEEIVAAVSKLIPGRINLVQGSHIISADEGQVVALIEALRRLRITAPGSKN